MQEIINIGGATFIFSPSPGVETASFGVFIKVGSRFEQKKSKGIAHFLEHLLFKGTRRYSHKEIKREIEGRGGLLNGFTSQEFTGYYAHFLNKNLKPTVDILLDMVFDPLIKKEDVAKERNVILEEIKMYNDLPSSRAGSLLDTLLWRNHALGEDVIGTFSTVTRITRSDMVHFKNNFYLPSSMVISCSGDFKKEDIIKLLGKKIKKNSLKARLTFSPPSGLKGVSIKVERRKLQQSYLCLGFRGVSYFSPERAKTGVLNVVLGGNMSSRLFEAVREKRGLCYDISTEARKYHDSGSFVISLGLDKSKVSLAIRSILCELGKIKEKRIPVKELERAKDYLLGQITMNLERPQGMMFHSAESYLTQGKIYSLEKIKREVRRITPEDLRKLSKKLFTFSRMGISCIGEFEEGLESKIKALIKRNAG